uniref:Putative secreted protein n=1 Tax=Anopheles darlingi TaxID=43151 RepID=A0A2M4DJC8_ANODA
MFFVLFCLLLVPVHRTININNQHCNRKCTTNVLPYHGTHSVPTNPRPRTYNFSQRTVIKILKRKETSRKTESGKMAFFSINYNQNDIRYGDT